MEESVGVVPVYRSGEETLFCLVRHAAGHWGFPKGHREANESDEAVAKRELREETGIVSMRLGSATFSERYSYERDGAAHEKTVRYFLGFVESPKAATPAAFKEEIPEIRWATFDEARAAITFAESRKVLEEVWQYLGEHLE